MISFTILVESMKQIVFLLLLFPLVSFAQGYMPAGARSGGVLNSSITFSDNWAYFNNPGALGQVETISAGISYENRFLLSGLQSQAIAVAVPTKYGVFSVGGFNYGSTEFKNFRTGLGYAMKLADNFSAGIQINYQGLRLPEYYGSSNTVTGEAGVLLNITNEWSFGASVFNLGRNHLSDYKDDRYNTVLRIGTAFKPSKLLNISAEFWKDLDGPVSVRGGIEYEPFKNFNLRVGAGSQPTSFAFGFGYKWKVIRFDFASAYHQTLGMSPQISITYQKDK
jgi:hypothetical protein